MIKEPEWDPREAATLKEHDRRFIKWNLQYRNEQPKQIVKDTLNEIRSEPYDPDTEHIPISVYTWIYPEDNWRKTRTEYRLNPNFVPKPQWINPFSLINK